jgi:hypothetical protein
MGVAAITAENNISRFMTEMLARASRHAALW